MPKMNSHGMTDQMFLFCQGYIKNGCHNTGGAYQKAYPNCSKKASDAAGSRLLKNVKVAKYLAGVQARASKKTDVTAERVLEELAKIGFSNMREFAEWGPDGVTLKISDEIPDEVAACVAEVSETITKEGGSIRFKLHDKPGALRDIARHLGMFTDKVEHTGMVEHTVSHTEKLLTRIDRMAANRLKHSAN